MNPIIKKALALIVIIAAIAGMGYQYFFAENIKTELFPNGNVKSVTNMIGQTAHGKSTIYHEVGLSKRGERSAVYNYVDGEKQGQATTYYSTGRKKTEVKYVDGKKSGVESLFSTSGRKIAETNYTSDVEGKTTKWSYHNGATISSEREFLNGIQINDEKTWHPNGKDLSLVSYVDGKRQGLATQWHDNATKSAEYFYVEGIQQGNTTHWNRSGQKVFEGSYENGKIAKATSWTYHANKAIASVNGMLNGVNHGEETTFYDTSEKSSQGEYVSGNKEGIHTLWHQDGKVKQTKNYKLNKLNGEAHTFNENGKLLEDAMYSHGVKGKSIKWTYNPDDILVSKKLYNNDVLHGLTLSYHPNTNPMAELNYSKGKLNGSVQRWNDQNSILEQSEYVNGQRGVAVEWTYNASNQMVSKTNLVHCRTRMCIGSKKEGVETKWHDNGVKSSSVNYKANKKNGVQITWFDTKVKKSEGLYTAGNKDGQHSIWYENGKQASLENFARGFSRYKYPSHYQMQGLQTYWDDKGNKTKEVEKEMMPSCDRCSSVTTRHTLFVDGKKHGVETLKYDDGTRKEDHFYDMGQNIDFSIWYDQAGEKSRQKNYQNKILLSDISYSNGNRNGKTKMYYKSGKLEREVDYVNNEKDGKEVYYYNNGSKEVEVNYKADIRDGEFINYYMSGKVHKSTAYKDGIEHGKKQVFYKSGALHNELTFKDGEKDGKVIWYYENGSLDQVVYFENGVRNDDKVEVYIPTPTGSLSIDSWIAVNNPASKHSKGMTGWVLSKLDDGSIQWLAHYTNGAINGLNVAFNTNGYKKREITWKNSSKYNTKDLNGKLTDWHSNGNKKYEAYYKSNPDGDSNYIDSTGYPHQNTNQEFYKTNKYGAYLHGVQTYFGEDGTQLHVVNYVNNEKTGLYTSFYTNGYKASEKTWKNASEEYTRDLNGKLTDWHSNGNKKYEAYYKSNPNGDGKYINQSGYPHQNNNQEYYKWNTYGAYLHGVQTYFGEDGTQSYVVNYVNNEKTGLYTSFYTNGYKASEKTWKNASEEYTRDLNGKLTDWHSNGNKKYEAHYRSNPNGDGKYINSTGYPHHNQKQEYYKTNTYGAFFHGPQTFYDANGRQTFKVTWNNNKKR